MRSLAGGTPGLYGGTQRTGSCDVGRQVQYLTAEPARARAFAGVVGITQDRVPAYLRGLTPVVLRADTRVTNHGYRDGRATAFQSVLQAGTAVLVDDRGLPRVRCACGNPLRPPVAFRQTPTHSGQQWQGYRPTKVVVVTPAPRPVTVIVIVNIVNNTWIERRTGDEHCRDDKPVPPRSRGPRTPRTPPIPRIRVIPPIPAMPPIRRTPPTPRIPPTPATRTTPATPTSSRTPPTAQTAQTARTARTRRTPPTAPTPPTRRTARTRATPQTPRIPRIPQARPTAFPAPPPPTRTARPSTAPRRARATPSAAPRPRSRPAAPRPRPLPAAADGRPALGRAAGRRPSTCGRPRVGLALAHGRGHGRCRGSDAALRRRLRILCRRCRLLFSRHLRRRARDGRLRVGPQER
ncbi:DUF6777 domain-containing protein [Streptomyces alboflavus]|uniref:DUF6777 domain-containing protein n=1 Tax=Streptomyces alboflavus TaxID=67267 RepID=UPI003AACB276